MRKLILALATLLVMAVPAFGQTVPLGPRFVLPYQTVIDPTGAPLPGAKLYFYVSGTNTPLNTYSDPLLTTPNTNPVVADSAGVFPNIFMFGTYKIVLTDSNGVTQWTADPVFGKNLNCPTFTSLLPGCVPASGGGASNFLRADGTWNAPDSASPPDPSVFGIASIITGIEPSIPAEPISGCTIISGGSGYSSTPTISSPVGNNYPVTLSGNKYVGGTGGGSVDVTVSGGVITGCTGSNTGAWTGQAEVVISDGSGSGGTVSPVISFQELDFTAGTLNVGGVTVNVPAHSFTGLSAASSGALGHYCISVNIVTGVWNNPAQEQSGGCLQNVPANSQIVGEVTTSAWAHGGAADIVAYNGWMKRSGQADFDFLNLSEDFPSQTSSYLNANTLPGSFAAPNVCGMGQPGSNSSCMFNANAEFWFSADIHPIPGTNVLDAMPWQIFRVNTARTQQNGDLLWELTINGENGNTTDEFGYVGFLSRIASVGTSGNSYQDPKGVWEFSTVGPESQLQLVPRFELGSGLYAGQETDGNAAVCGQFTTPSGAVTLDDQGASTINLCGAVSSNNFGNPTGYYLDNKIVLQTSKWTLYGSAGGSNYIASDGNGSIGIGTTAPSQNTGWDNSLELAGGQNSALGLLVDNGITAASAQAVIGMGTGTPNSVIYQSLKDNSGSPAYVVSAGNGAIDIGATYEFGGGYTWANRTGSSIWAQLSGSGLSLGSAGAVAGKLILPNATSGNVTLTVPTGALGNVTATLPDNTGTLAEINLAQTWSALQTFNTGAFAINGGSATAGLATVSAAGVISSAATASLAQGGFGQSMAAAAGLPCFNSGLTMYDTTGAIKVSAGTCSQAATTDLSDVSTGSWTPADASGAGLTFTASNTNYIKIGKEVLVWGVITWPSTASGANAFVSGLPFTSLNTTVDYVFGGPATRNTSGFSNIGISKNGTTFALINTSNALVTNATMSGQTIQFGINYSTN